MEARARFELAIKDLQSSALDQLCYPAIVLFFELKILIIKNQYQFLQQLQQRSNRHELILYQNQQRDSLYFLL
jgi:hypothetical protein